MKFSIYIYILIILASSFSCKKEFQKYSFFDAPETFVVKSTYNKYKIPINTDADVESMNLRASAHWVSNLAVTNNVNNQKEIYLEVEDNLLTETRELVITIEISSSPSINIRLIQERAIFRTYVTNYIHPDTTGMKSNAVTLTNAMTLGWNLGHAFELPGGEEGSGNPPVQEELIKLVKESGFNTIRIPVAWDLHADQATAEINPAFLKRVKEVVQYCIDNNLYVILNLYSDRNSLYYSMVPENKEMLYAKHRAYWEQIAMSFREFDERLIFSSTNYRVLVSRSNLPILYEYHETFIKAVYSTGGKNTYRKLVLTFGFPDPQFVDKTSRLTSNRIIYEFEIDNVGYYYEDIPSTYDLNQNEFIIIRRDIPATVPAILGKFGVFRRNDLQGNILHSHLQQRYNHHKKVIEASKHSNIVPIYWDNGITDSTYTYGIFDRNTNTVYDSTVLNALLSGLK